MEEKIEVGGKGYKQMPETNGCIGCAFNKDFLGCTQHMNDDANGCSLNKIIWVLDEEVAKNQDNALSTQVGGGHYKGCGIQPIQYIHSNNIGYCEGNVIKYVSRWKDKNGVEDLKKAKHYIDLLIELEGLNE